MSEMSNLYKDTRINMLYKELNVGVFFPLTVRHPMCWYGFIIYGMKLQDECSRVGSVVHTNCSTLVNKCID